MKELSAPDILSLIDNENISQPKVLIIEDCTSDTVLIKATINSFYSYALIDDATTKEEAISKLSAHNYDLIFLDLKLPDTQGLSDIGEIRERCKETPLIIVTGFLDKETKDTAKKFKVNGIISKAELANTELKKLLEDAVDNIIFA